MLEGTENAVRPPPAVDLSMLLNQASYAVTNRLAEALAAIDVSVKVYCVLAKGVEGDFTQAQLAERTLSPTDRRVRVVAITAKGRQLLLRADALVQAVYDDVLDTLPAPGKA